MDPPEPALPTVSMEALQYCHTPINDDHDDKYGIPTLDELGFDTHILRQPIWIGGETEALARLERHLAYKSWIASFGQAKMTPQSLYASQTGLSPYLRFGCLSTRLFYHELCGKLRVKGGLMNEPNGLDMNSIGDSSSLLSDLYKKIKKAQPPLSLYGQILWREFFYCAATRNANFDKMEGNTICVQVPWDKNPKALAKWAMVGHIF